MNIHVGGRRSMSDDGYSVLDDTLAFVGRVIPVRRPSHIRRGRMQASPWWQAVDPQGNPVGGLHQRRADAAEELARPADALDVEKG